jgi:hypothetical protein
MATGGIELKRIIPDKQVRGVSHMVADGFAQVGEGIAEIIQGSSVGKLRP